MFIKSYGDTLNDGAVQLSFTLPVEECAKAREAAQQFVLKLGFDSCEIVESRKMAEGYTFFVVYGKTSVSVDYDKIEVQEAAENYMSYKEISNYIEENIGRKVVVVGACTGTDAHTVGIDAIMNMKGFDGNYGLERYRMVEAHNLGAQVPNEDLIAYAKKVNADAILVSQVVTQKDVHIKNMTEFIEMLEAEGIRDRFILVAGGPRINHKFALELGFDVGFGRGSYANHVGTFIVEKMVERKLNN